MAATHFIPKPDGEGRICHPIPCLSVCEATGRYLAPHAQIIGGGGQAFDFAAHGLMDGAPEAAPKSPKQKQRRKPRKNGPAGSP